MDTDEGRRARVRFGPKPHQTIPHEWAERIIMNLAKDNPSNFGNRLRAVVIADLPTDGKHADGGEQ